MADSSFSLVPVWQIVWNWRKRIVAFVTLISVATTVTVFLLPKYFLSVSLAVPGNPMLADKGKLFNNNIQSLYSPYGGTDELDRLTGIGELDTVYKTIIGEFGLTNYYGLAGSDTARAIYKTLKALREDLKVQQTEKGQLKVMMWHEDSKVAAAIVNRVMDMIQQIAMKLQVQNNQQSLDNLYATIKAISPVPGDTINYVSPAHGGTYDPARIEQYLKIVQELQLAIANNPAALIIQERGYAAGKEDKPKKLSIIAAAFFLSLLFAVLTALFYNRSRNDAAAV